MMMKQVRRPDPPSRVLTNLKGKTLGELTVNDYNDLIDNAFIEESSLQFISDLASIMKFQEKPKGLQLVKVGQSGLVNSSSYVTLLEIPAGKTYDIQVVCAIATSGDSVITYALDAVDFSGLQYILKNVTYDGTDGVAGAFTTQGDFLLSGLADQSTFLVAKRASGRGSVGGHNVFYREVN